MATEMSYNQYIQLLNTNVIFPLCKLEFLNNSDESVRSSIVKLPLDSSSLTADASSGIRRSLSLVLDNSNKDFIPSIDTLWMGFKFQLYLGYQDNQGRQIFFPQGVFVVFNNNPSISSSYSQKEVSIRCDDKMALWNIPIGHIYIVPPNTKLTDIIRSILVLLGDKKEPIIQEMGDMSPYSLTWSSDVTYQTMLRDITNLFSRESFYDTTGHFVYREFVDEVTAETVFDFTEGQFYMGATREMKYDQTYNHIYVTGANMSSSGVFSAESRNDDLTSNTRISLVGDKPMPIITDSKISSNDLCQQRSDMELIKAKRVQETISLNCLTLFHIDVNKVINVTDDSLGLDHQKFVIQQFSIPLNAKTAMTITGFLHSGGTDFMDRLSVNTTTS